MPVRHIQKIAAVVFVIIGLGTSQLALAKTYTKVELLTIVLNSTYTDKAKVTKATCDSNVTKPQIEIAFSEINTEGKVASASVYDGTNPYTSEGTIKRKKGYSYYVLKLTGTYTDASADYDVTLTGRIKKTDPYTIKKGSMKIVQDLNEDFSVDKCKQTISFVAKAE